jgi:hypothetical protein
MRHGSVSDGTRAIDALELGFMVPTQEVLADLYEWATVTKLTERARVA